MKLLIHLCRNLLRKKGMESSTVLPCFYVFGIFYDSTTFVQMSSIQVCNSHFPWLEGGPHTRQSQPPARGAPLGEQRLVV
jgi:hypothetical protein